jgi:hypothetical protein
MPRESIIKPPTLSGTQLSLLERMSMPGVYVRRDASFRPLRLRKHTKRLGGRVLHVKNTSAVNGSTLQSLVRMGLVEVKLVGSSYNTLLRRPEYRITDAGRRLVKEAAASRQAMHDRHEAAVHSPLNRKRGA